jgi:hypothetical protein
MKGSGLFLVALASYAAAGAIPSTVSVGKTSSLTSKTASLSGSKPASSATGTWIYYSTVTDESSSSVTSYDPITVTDHVYIPNKTTITKSTDLTLYAATATVTRTKYSTGRTFYVDPTPGASSVAIVTDTATPAGFTPIASEFAYTASVKISTTTSTTTYTLTLSEGPTSTITKTSTAKPQTITKTVITSTITAPATTTKTKTTTLATYITSTRRSFPTHHAICDENSGNYVDHFPFGVPFEALSYDSSDPNDQYGSTHALDRSGIYSNQTFDLRTKVDCCNFAMTNLAAWGYWYPQGNDGPNQCYVFNVRDQSQCTPSEVKYTLVPVDNITPDPASNGVFAL